MFTLDNKKATALYWVSALGFLYSLFIWEWNWFLVSVIIHVITISIFSAVTHRYFCHRAFDANPNTMFWFSLFPMIYGFACPISWSFLHTAHHAHADTDRDTHIKGLKGILTAFYKNPTSLRYAANAKWFYNDRHDMVRRNAVLFTLIPLVLLTLINFKLTVWMLLVPWFTLHLVEGIHRTFSHNSTGATNKWYMEYILPLGGEWIHDKHHDKPTDPVFGDKFYMLDAGNILVNLLKK
jgi:stearoyl-CoA desaturase (delta-9 desaturase)